MDSEFSHYEEQPESLTIVVPRDTSEYREMALSYVNAHGGNHADVVYQRNPVTIVDVRPVNAILNITQRLD